MDIVKYFCQLTYINNKKNESPQLEERIAYNFFLSPLFYEYSKSLAIQDISHTRVS